MHYIWLPCMEDKSSWDTLLGRWTELASAGLPKFGLPTEVMTPCISTHDLTFKRPMETQALAE